MISHDFIMQVVNGKPKGLTSEASRSKAEEEFRFLAHHRGDEVLGEYVNNRTKIKMRNKLTGETFEVTPLSYKQRQDTFKCRPKAGK